jgi:hypothetical protein
MEVYTTGNSWKRPNQFHSFIYQRISDREKKSEKQKAKKPQPY